MFNRIASKICMDSLSRQTRIFPTMNESFVWSEHLVDILHMTYMTSQYLHPNLTTTYSFKKRLSFVSFQYAPDEAPATPSISTLEEQLPNLSRVLSHQLNNPLNRAQFFSWSVIYPALHYWFVQPVQNQILPCLWLHCRHWSFPQNNHEHLFMEVE